MKDYNMKRIIIHHTAGTYKPNQTDLEHYHYLIDDIGCVYSGKYKPEDNIDCTDGSYAAHTYLGNTKSIGIAACCNYNFNLRDKESEYPITRKQFETLCRLAARMCRKYKIDINNVYTHFGYDKLKNINQGKIDITYLPFKPELNPFQVQDFFRAKIRWYINKSLQ